MGVKDRRVLIRDRPHHLGAEPEPGARIVVHRRGQRPELLGRLREAGETQIEEALQAMAMKAMDRKTGARGLRSILESVLLDTMYEIPSAEGITKVVIDEAVINGGAEPYLVYENEKQIATSAK